MFSLDSLHRAMAELFRESGDEVDERTPRGTSALVSFPIDQHGVPDLDSLTLGSAPWALGRLLRPGRDLGGVEDLERDRSRLVAALAAEIPINPDAVSAPDTLDTTRQNLPPIDHTDLDRLTARAAALLGVNDTLCPDGTVLIRRLLKRGEEHPPGDGLLNSFYAADLGHIAQDVARHGAGGALGPYLGSTLPHRTDVRDAAAQPRIEELLAPRQIPAGRWPSDSTRALSTSQQLAVNTISRLADESSGVFGVNGPPGTGKSTLLRDVIADAVTRRAHVLASLADPKDAFDENSKTGWRTPRFTHSFVPLRSDVAGFEIVIASANNGAVENVSREIPDRGALDPAWKDRRYLIDAAQRLGGEEAWGLLTAVLGKSANRRAFVQRLWWGHEETTDRGSSANDAPRGPLLDREMRNRHARSHSGQWQEAVASFQAACAREAEIREERAQIKQLADQIPTLRAEVETAMKDVDRARRALDDARSALGEAEYAQSSAVENLDRESAARDRMLASRPNFWESIWDLGASSRRWRRHLTEQETREEASRSAADHAATAVALASERVHSLEGALVDRHRNLTACQEIDRAALEHLELLRDAGDFTWPTTEWREDPVLHELHPLWMDQAWNTARSEVFLAALELHEEFAVLAWPLLGPGVNAAMDVIGRGASPDAPANAVLEAWRHLFLLTPAVSTTFASVSRVFAEVPAGAFGWLIIDEAGQAAPQAAVGALWRARRAVAVGDPLQLEPIVTALHTTQGQLRAAHDLPELWTPERHSVQSLVDRVTWLGTTLTGEGGELWVGSPLTAHRRCDEPMFSVFNDAVYAGTMVHGFPARGADEDLRMPEIPESAWLDVRESNSQGKWRPAEGELLVETLHHLLGIADENDQLLLSLEDVLVLAPFTQVAERARDAVKAAKIPVTAGDDQSVTVGTVHTAQGKQAKVVIFVLGSDPRREGSRTWASAKPNLLNVAVSRAKHRLFVIGQRDHWAHLPYFRELASHLPTVDTQRPAHQGYPPSQ